MFESRERLPLQRNTDSRQPCYKTRRHSWPGAWLVCAWAYPAFSGYFWLVDPRSLLLTCWVEPAW